MEMFLAILEAVAAIIGIGMIGFAIIARRVIPVDVFPVIIPLVVDVALPCLIFTNIITKFEPTRLPDWWALPLWWVGFTFITLSLSVPLSFLSSRVNRKEFRATLFYQNAIFLPLAVITGLFGSVSEHAVSLFLFTILYSAFFFNTYFFFFRKRVKANGFKLNGKLLLNPVLLATILSLTLRLTGWSIYIPQFIMTITTLLGYMTLPLIMLIIGGNIYIDYRNTSSLQWKEVLKFVLAKNIVIPSVVLTFLFLVKLPYTVALLFAIEASTPPITAIPIMAERVGGNRSIINQYFIASYAAALVTMPLVVALFMRMYS